jgi:hypothetical protein
MNIKTVIQIFYITSLTLFISSCSLFQTKQTQAPTITIAPNQTVELPSPSELDFNLVATQILTAEYQIKDKKDTYSSQVQIEKKGNRLVMVALGGWGGEIFSLQYDGNQIKSSSLPMPHANMGIKYALSDFILTYAPANVLTQMFKQTDIKVIASPLERTFLLKGKIIIEILYQNPDPWKGKIELSNNIYHYQIDIQTLSSKPY